MMLRCYIDGSGVYAILPEAVGVTYICIMHRGHGVYQEYCVLVPCIVSTNTTHMYIKTMLHPQLKADGAVVSRFTQRRIIPGDTIDMYNTHIYT